MTQENKPKKDNQDIADMIHQIKNINLSDKPSNPEVLIPEVIAPTEPMPNLLEPLLKEPKKTENFEDLFALIKKKDSWTGNTK